jgi:hypothetical protein
MVAGCRFKVNRFVFFLFAINLRADVAHAGAASSRDFIFRGTYFRGAKPLPRGVDALFATLGLTLQI